MKESLIDLEKGIKGLVVMSADLEEVFSCINHAQVPPLWGKVKKGKNDITCNICALSSSFSFSLSLFLSLFLSLSLSLSFSPQTFPSLKPLGAWTRDLVLRVEQFNQWSTTAHPPIHFWLSGFTFPTGFLTAVLQTAARKNNVSPQ